MRGEGSTECVVGGNVKRFTSLEVTVSRAEQGGCVQRDLIHGKLSARDMLAQGKDGLPVGVVSRDPSPTSGRPQ